MRLWHALSAARARKTVRSFVPLEMAVWRPNSQALDTARTRGAERSCEGRDVYSLASRWLTVEHYTERSLTLRVKHPQSDIISPQWETILPF